MLSAFKKTWFQNESQLSRYISFSLTSNTFQTTLVTLVKKWVKNFLRTLKSWKPIIKDDWMSI